MTANRNLLRMKYARVVEAYAAKTGCSLDDSLKTFYRSQTYQMMRDGVFRYALHEHSVSGRGDSF